MKSSLHVSEHLAQLYTHQPDHSAFPQGGREKAANIRRLCTGIPHDSLLEIGCADGRVLDALVGFATQLHGIDINRRARPDHPADIRTYDGYDLPYADKQFDLVVMTHVLEHLEYPRRLLYEAGRVGRHVFLEIPLMDKWRMGRDFKLGRSGHINAWSQRTFRHFVQSCQFTVLAQELTVSRCQRHALIYWLKRLAPLPRLYTYHCAMLCRMP